MKCSAFSTTAKVLLLLQIIILSGCGAKTAKPRFEVNIAKNVSYTLLPPEVFGGSKVATQSVVADWDNKKFRFMSQIEITPDSLTLAGFSLLGNQLFYVIVRNGILKSRVEPSIEKKLDPRYLAADFQLTYWPLEMLQRQFENSAVKIIGKKLPDYGRSIYFQGKKIIDISYQHATPWKGEVVFKHLERRYILSVTTHSFESL